MIKKKKKNPNKWPNGEQFTMQKFSLHKFLEIFVFITERREFARKFS